MQSKPRLAAHVFRIVLGALLGGVAAFNAGFVGHMVFGWPERNFQAIDNEDAVREILQAGKIAAGMYMIPKLPQSLSPEERTREEQTYADRYKQGPSGLLVVHPPQQEMMSTNMLVYEFATNTFCYLLAAWVVSLLSPGRSFATRFGVVLALSLFAWASIVASYGIWYRFSSDFLLDELLNALLEGTLAGLFVASIVRPYPSPAQPPG